jgi:hypothetical protein
MGPGVKNVSSPAEVALKVHLLLLACIGLKVLTAQIFNISVSVHNRRLDVVVSRTKGVGGCKKRGWWL